MKIKDHCRVGTRSSALALWQTHYVIDLLKKDFPDCTFEVVEMSTKGDRILNQSLSAIGDKGLFTQELEHAMLNGDIDFAVHSLKDMPTSLPEGLGLTAMTRRQDPRDALLAKKGTSIESLPEGAVVGTSSLRRKSQLLHRRPDLKVIDLRGNVQTRIKKFLGPQYDAAVLATVGLERMALDDHIVARLSVEEFVPAVGQGIVVVESRQNDEAMLNMLAKINDTETWQCAAAERAFMRTVEGGCQIPIGALAEADGEELLLRGFIGSLDGSQSIVQTLRGKKADSEALGKSLAMDMLENGGRDLLRAIRGTQEEA